MLKACLCLLVNQSFLSPDKQGHGSQDILLRLNSPDINGQLPLSRGDRVTHKRRHFHWFCQVLGVHLSETGVYGVDALGGGASIS